MNTRGSLSGDKAANRRVQFLPGLGDKIYDECIGLDYSVALGLHLYFYTLRDIISWAPATRIEILL